MMLRLFAWPLLIAALPLGAAFAQPEPTTSTQAPAVESSQARALDALAADHPEMVVQRRALIGTPTLITRLAVPTEGATPRERADHFLGVWSEALGLPPGALSHVRQSEGAGRYSVHYQQVHEGHRVLGRFVVVTLDEAGLVRSVSSDAIPVQIAPEQGEVDEAAASVEAILAVHGEAAPTLETPTERVVISDVTGASFAWRVRVAQRGSFEPLFVLVDARDGRVFGIQRPSLR